MASAKGKTAGGASKKSGLVKAWSSRNNVSFESSHISLVTQIKHTSSKRTSFLAFFYSDSAPLLCPSSLYQQSFISFAV